jgi:hypothetical protein
MLVDRQGKIVFLDYARKVKNLEQDLDDLIEGKTLNGGNGKNSDEQIDFLKIENEIEELLEVMKNLEENEKVKEAVMKLKYGYNILKF